MYPRHLTVYFTHLSLVADGVKRLCQSNVRAAAPAANLRSESSHGGDSGVAGLGVQK